MIIKDKVNDLYEVMVKEDKEKKSNFTTERKAFWITHYMQINLDIPLSISSLRSSHWEFGLAKNCKFSHQITKQDTNKTENEVSLSDFSLRHQDKVPNVSPFPSPWNGAAKLCWDVWDTQASRDQWGPHEALVGRMGHMYERWDSKSHLYPIIINN